MQSFKVKPLQACEKEVPEEGGRLMDGKSRNIKIRVHNLMCLRTIQDVIYGCGLVVRCENCNACYSHELDTSGPS